MGVASITPSPHALEKAFAWAKRPEEFVKRAGFVLMARKVVRDKALPDATARRFLRAAKAGARDARPLVRKGASWAMREAGKRRAALRAEVVALAREMAASADAGECWVGKDVLRDVAR
ncbi:MAG TPA: DNA alkylation repair protein [Candidatus Thermoplasmatota archaeon]|nr:DNA alkylation repair protein [Candidatus Thermoplasmatota archaeon]